MDKLPVIFDSNVWIALFNENDIHHQKALRLFSESTVIYIPEYIVLEITTALQQRASKLKADSFVNMVTATVDAKILYATDDFFQIVKNIFQQQNKKLSFVDCALLALTKHYTIHTFDDVLARAILKT